MTYAPSFPPADDLLALAASVADRLRRVQWRARSRAGADAVLTAVAVIHALGLRLAPHVARALRWLADQLDTQPAAPMAVTADPDGWADARLYTLSRQTVADMRSLARKRGIRTICDRPVKYAKRGELINAIMDSFS